MLGLAWVPAVPGISSMRKQQLIPGKVLPTITHIKSLVTSTLQVPLPTTSHNKLEKNRLQSSSEKINNMWLWLAVRNHLISLGTKQSSGHLIWHIFDHQCVYQPCWFGMAETEILHFRVYLQRLSLHESISKVPDIGHANQGGEKFPYSRDIPLLERRVKTSQ